MEVLLSRKEYTKLAALGSEYPLQTGAALTELRHRGADASTHILEMAIRNGVVSPPRGKRNYEWRPEDLDAVTLWAEEKDVLVEGARAARFFGIRYSVLQSVLSELACEGKSLEEAILQIGNGTILVREFE